MYFYEKIIEVEEVGIEGGLELLLKNYRYGLSGEDGCGLVDRYGTLIATINTNELKPHNLIIQCGGVWQQPFRYSFKGDFISPLSVKKIIGQHTKM